MISCCCATPRHVDADGYLYTPDDALFTCHYAVAACHVAAMPLRRHTRYYAMLRDFRRHARAPALPSYARHAIIERRLRHYTRALHTPRHAAAAMLALDGGMFIDCEQRRAPLLMPAATPRPPLAIHYGCCAVFHFSPYARRFRQSRDDVFATIRYAT